MTSILNPDDLHDPTALGYSHTVTVPAGSALVLVAGQYASDETGGVSAPAFAPQVEQSLDRLATALAAHDLSLTDVVSLRTYVVGLDGPRLGALGQAVGRIWGDRPPAHTVLGVAALALPEMLVELEAVAARP